MTTEKLTWQAPEYLYRQKTADWYWIVAIVTISISLIAIILNNIIFAILIIVSSFTLSLFASRHPKIINVEVDENGVTVDKTRYSYANLDSFWVETGQAHPKVLLKAKKILMPYIVILINDIEPEEVKLVLFKHLQEEEHTEPLLEKFLIYFGF